MDTPRKTPCRVGRRNRSSRALAHNTPPYMSHRPPHPLQNRVHGLQIEFLRMEPPASPPTEMAEFLVPWLEDDLQELLITGRPANIFWRAPALTGKADWLRRGIGWQDLLQHDMVQPIIAEVVDVDHRVALDLQNTADRNFAFINDLDISLKSGSNG